MKIEKIQFQEINEVIKIKKFDVRFKGVEVVEGPNYISQKGNFEVFIGNSFFTNLEPEKRFYNAGKQVTTEAAIHSTVFGDLYIALGDKNFSRESESWTTRIWFNPFTAWIWSGIFFIVLGGLISFFRLIKQKK